MQAHLKYLLEKYKQDGCTPEEAKILLEYLKESDPDLLAELIAEGLFDEVDREAEANIQDTLDRVFARITNKVNREPSVVVMPKRKRSFVYVAAAAVVLLVFAWGYATDWFGRFGRIEQVTVSTTTGETKEVVLPDGSVVWLNDASSITYSDQFNKYGKRAVTLEGEAFFEVVANPDRPFDIALPGDLRVTVLGTAFSVKAFAEETGAKVSLLHGKVNVSSAGGEILLREPGEQAVYERSTTALLKHQIDTAYIGQWRNRMLAFDGDTMQETLNALGRRYNVSFQVRKPGLQESFVTLSVKDEPLEEILKPLSFSHGFKYSYANDSTIVIQ